MLSTVNPQPCRRWIAPSQLVLAMLTFMLLIGSTKPPMALTALQLPAVMPAGVQQVMPNQLQ